MGTHRRDGSALARRQRGPGAWLDLALTVSLLAVLIASVAGALPAWVAGVAGPLLIVKHCLDLAVEWWRTRHDRPQRQRMLPRLDPDYRRRR